MTENRIHKYQKVNTQQHNTISPVNT